MILMASLIGQTVSHYKILEKLDEAEIEFSSLILASPFIAFALNSSGSLTLAGQESC
jgi:hypothetical protein